jgi:hypothetical protein
MKPAKEWIHGSHRMKIKSPGRYELADSEYNRKVLLNVALSIIAQMVSLMSLRLSEKIIYSTVRIEYIASDEKLHGGTGFVFEFSSLPGVYVVVSNKHVAKDSIEGGFVFNLEDGNGNLVRGQFLRFKADAFSKSWYYHPDSNIDLAIMPVGGIFNHWLKQGSKPFITRIDSSTIPNETEWRELHTLEDVLIVGYPDLIMDSINNLPLSIKGATATHPNFNYDGKKEFLVSAGIYPGSSGSPVFLVDDNFYEKSKNSPKEGERDKARLLGIIYAGFEYSVEGKIVKSIPETQFVTSTADDRTIISKIPMGITSAIRSTALKDFEPILEGQLNKVEKSEVLDVQ